MPDNTNDL